MRRALAARAALALLMLVWAVPCGADSGSAAARKVPQTRIPQFFDPDYRSGEPDAGAVRSIRFLTTDDDPPFHFTLADGTLTGFDIDLARAICRDLKLACTIQARRFDTLVGEIKAGHDDALIAAVANNPTTRKDLTFTDPYYTTPGRFVTKLQGSPLDAKGRMDEITPASLAGHAVGVEAGTAHEAFLKTFFPKAQLKTYRNGLDLRQAMKNGEVEAIFADGIALALWLNGSDSAGCCAFRGGPFTEPRFFGNGVSIAVAENNVALRQVLDFELAKLSRDGTYADLYLKYFPIGFY